jgi:hypothetical protein
LIKGGINLFEKEKSSLAFLFHFKDSVLEYKAEEQYQLAGIKDTRGQLENFTVFQMIDSKGLIDMDHLMQLFKDSKFSQEDLGQWTDDHLIIKGRSQKSFQEILIEQITEAIKWRLYVILIINIRDR